MKYLPDITGRVFGRVKAICPFGKNKYGHNQWLYQCDCGNEKFTTGNSLIHGLVKSCGCIHSDFVRRFWAKVRKTRSCWIWTGPKTSKQRPYGRIQVNGKATLTHRLSWAIAYGPLNDEEKVIHKCDNPPCVRPTHLTKGTHSENMKDMVAKGRNIVPSKKLAPTQVLEIRKLAKAGFTYVKIGHRFGIDRSQICRIVNRVYWTSVK